jgi:hypothetical protein
VQVSVAKVQFQPAPLMAVAVNADGNMSVSVTVPEVVPLVMLFTMSM